MLLLANMRLFFVLLLVPFASARIRSHRNGHNGPFIVEVDEAKRYKPDWSDLDTRPLPEWYDKAKIGIFIHWGVFSVPSYVSEWFWNYWLIQNNGNIKSFMAKNYPPGFTYQDFAPMFKAEFFRPAEWADLFLKAGARYVVLTTKHHEGYTLFPSSRSFSWNAMDVGPHQDLVGALEKAIKNTGIKFGVYHSLYEWFNPIYIKDRDNKFTTQVYPEIKLLPDLKQLITDYKPSLLWSDGDAEAYDTYWNSTEFLAWLYNDSPVKEEIVVNDRWGKGTACKHGDFYNCEDDYHPGTLQAHKWESAFTLDIHSWGYRRNIDINDIRTMKELLSKVVISVSCGGNALINIGPTKEGTIAPIFQERLLSLGNWLQTNGEAIYESSPWTHQNDSLNPDVWYTCHKTKYKAGHPTARPSKHDKLTAIYAIFLNWPEDNVLKVNDLAPVLNTNPRVEILGGKGDIKWSTADGVVSILLPNQVTVQSSDAWVLKIVK